MNQQVRIAAVLFALVSSATLAGTASAHVHVVSNPNHSQQLANGQNHPGFVGTEGGDIISCEGVNEPANAGPAGYGLETAHHGPDAGQPGKADGCFAGTDDAAPGLRPPDTNPAID
jgi:hypothetical protein